MGDGLHDSRGRASPRARWHRGAVMAALAVAAAGCVGHEERQGVLTELPWPGPSSPDAGHRGEGDGTRPGPQGEPGQLDAPGRVVFDEDGIPHIYARSDLDAFFLQGWATASQRLYQMDITRRRALGQRAELFGEEHLRTDVLMRALRLGEWAERTEAALKQDDPELLAFLEAYAAGVNAWMAQAPQAGATEAGAQGLAPQLAALGYEPAPWTVRDTLAIEKLVATGLSMRPEQDLTLGLLRLLLGPELFSDLYRIAPFDREYVTPDFYEREAAGALQSTEEGLAVAGARTRGEAARRAMQAQLATLAPAEIAAAIRAAGALRLSEGGSNNWVVAGAHTASGAPILAGDTHQGVTHPATYHFVHVDSMSLPGAQGTVNVIGASFPGVPFVAFGHNGTAGFMPTTSIYDQADTYLETFDAAAGTVQFEGEAVPVDTRTEVIRVRAPGGAVADAAPRAYTLHAVPHHGPMLPTEALGLPVPLTVSIRWTGYRPRSLGRAFFEMNRCQSFEGFRAALDHLSAAGTHWLYADTSGEIGFSSRVDLPVREQVDPDTPPIVLLPGQGGYEWRTVGGDVEALETVDRALIPWRADPEAGWMVTANNDPVGHTDDGAPFGEPVYLSGVFDIGTRALQPRRRLEQARERGPLTLEQVADIQLDGHSRLGERLADFVGVAAARRPDLLDARMEQAVALLGAWDFGCEVDSPGATLFHAWLFTFSRLMLEDEAGGLLGSVLTQDLDGRVGLVVTKCVAHWLEATAERIDEIEAGRLPFPSASGTNFFDRQDRPGLQTRDELILEALAQALDELEALFASKVPPGDDPIDPQSWRWGLWHVIQLPDLAEAWLPGASSPVLPKGGCMYTVDVADHDWLQGGALPPVLMVDNAASNRFALELLPDGVVGIGILPGGQDERPGSPHHVDQLSDFTQGRYRPLRYSPSEVDAATARALEFEPGYPMAPGPREGGR